MSLPGLASPPPPRCDVTGDGSRPAADEPTERGPPLLPSADDDSWLATLGGLIDSAAPAAASCGGKEVVLWTEGEPSEPLLVDVGRELPPPPLLPLSAWLLLSEPSLRLCTLELTVGESMAASRCESLVTDGTDCAYGLFSPMSPELIVSALPGSLV